MDPITVGGVAFSWLAAMIGGSLLTIGVMETLSGRAMINLNQVNWTREEATLLGLTRVVQGLDSGIYGLVGALFLSRVVDFPFAGHVWGLFLSLPLGVIFLATLFAQALIAAQNQRRARSGPR